MNEKRVQRQHLNDQEFGSVIEAQVLTDIWRDEYDLVRLHSSLGYVPPVEFKQEWEQQHQSRLLGASTH